MYGLILAGGSGVRLWPLSRLSNPKQLLKINADTTLIQEAFNRLNTFIIKDKIFAIANFKHTIEIKKQLLMSNNSAAIHILSEPISKNTAPALSLATKYLLDKGIDEVVIAIPADHRIKDTNKFVSAVKEAEKLANQNYIVTLGIKPTKPATEFGYIKVGNKLETGFKVDGFKEKPNIEKAKEYIANDRYFWNAGMFVFKPSVLMQAIRELAPQIFNISQYFDFELTDNIDPIQFERFPSISIDYAVMEKASNIAMVPLESDWSDLGSWDVIYSTSNKDEYGNVIVGTTAQRECTNSMLYGTSRQLVGVGLQDIIVVETPDAVLVCHKDKVQEVKAALSQVANIYKY